MINDKIFLLIFFSFFSENFVNCVDNGYYTIIAPKQVRPHSNYTVSLTYMLKNTSLPATVLLGIEDGTTSYKNEQTVRLDSNKTYLISLPLDDIKYHKNYRFYAEGVMGLSFKENLTLRTETKNVSFLIQTDKAIYKPADIIKFRVLVLNSKLTPALLNANTLNVYILDADKNRVKQWKGVQTNKGVFSEELTLSEHPMLGQWTINAELDGDSETKSKSIEIAEYVLPKFETTIDSPDHFSIKDSKIRAIIRSKYTYGKFVKGKAIVSITPKTGPSYYGVSPSNNIVIKTIPIDGKGVIEFDTETESKIHFETYQSSVNYQLHAIVIEELSGRNQSTSKSITIHKMRYNIMLNSNSSLIPGRPIPLTIKVTYQDGTPVLINDETKQITLVKPSNGNDPEIYKNYELNSNATVNIEYLTTEKDSSLSLKVKYLDEETSYNYFYPSRASKTDGMNIKFLTKKPRLNKLMTIEIQFTEPIDMLNYLVISHGKIRVAETAAVPNRNYHVVKFPITFDLIPTASFIAYYFKDGAIITKKAILELDDNSNNFVKIKLSSDRLEAGGNITIDLTTNPKSYVGLAAIDQSVLLLKSGNDLTVDEVFRELNDYEAKGFGSIASNPKYIDEFLSTGVYILTNGISQQNHHNPQIQHDNAFIAFNEPIQQEFIAGSDPSETKESNEIRIRKDFPETWLWDSISDENFNGSARIQKIVPDSITSWMISAFSIDPEMGLALTKVPKTLEVFQPFFVSMNLPYSVKRDEIVAISIIVYNYFEDDIDAELIVYNENNEFEFIDNDSNQLQRKKALTIKSNEGVSHSIIFRPKKVGLISIKATAKSAMAGDGVVQLLLVEPEGLLQFENEAILVDLRGMSKMDVQYLDIDIPEDAIPNSTYIEIKCMGDILGGTIMNLQNLIHLPSGCGEQNMLNFVPNIVILDYLNATGQLKRDVEDMAKKYTEQGYQRELSYKHSDGSFSAFGKVDKDGSTWLTAFVAKSFRQAAKYIDIEESVILKALEWLSKVQAPDGSFPEIGRVLHKDMQGGSGNGIALTAYTLITFLENKKDVPIYEKTINKAIDKIVKSVKDIDDLYAIAIASYALQLADHPTKSDVLAKFINLAETKDDKLFWSKSKNFDDRKRKHSKTINVEITAYGLFALIEAEKLTDGLAVLKWLLSQRNENGGFEGTQDTVLGLQALAKFAKTVSTKDKDVHIYVKSSKADDFEINVNNENALVLQSFQLSPDSRSIEVSASGHGFALLQLSYRYHLNSSEAEPSFLIKPKLTEKSNAAHVNLEVCLSFNPQDETEKNSNMVVLEVSLPSGFTVELETTYSLAKTDYVKRVETKNSDTVFVVYFDNLKADELICRVFDAYRIHKIAEQKPVPIIVYDYYDSSKSAREFYSMPAITSCDICDGVDCSQLCVKGGKQLVQPLK